MPNHSTQKSTYDIEYQSPRLRQAQTYGGFKPRNWIPTIHGSRWFYQGTPSSSTTKSGRHDRAEMLMKMALNTIS